MKSFPPHWRTWYSRSPSTSPGISVADARLRSGWHYRRFLLNRGPRRSVPRSFLAL